MTENEMLRELERQRFRAECKVRCLTAALDRVDVNEFDRLMDRLERAIEDAKQAAQALYRYQTANFSRFLPRSGTNEAADGNTNTGNSAAESSSPTVEHKV